MRRLNCYARSRRPPNVVALVSSKRGRRSGRLSASSSIRQSSRDETASFVFAATRRRYYPDNAGRSNATESFLRYSAFRRRADWEFGLHGATDISAGIASAEG